MTDQQMILTLSCPDRRGIVAAVSTFLFEKSCNIIEAQQFADPTTHVFFMRVSFSLGDGGATLETISDLFKPLGDEFSMTWTIRPVAQKKRVMILVSKFDHCLADLLYRWRAGELDMDVTAIVANHPRETYAHLDFGSAPFHYLPVTKQTKLEQETQIWSLVKETKTDVVVLARYMQVLSDGLSAKLSGRCINIHHSFLPGFKGAKPYHQAHDRGVKIIGATAHFVSTEQC